jgi:predicted dehydrogenase
MIRPHIVRREPLRVEYEAFIDSITHGTKSPVSGEEGKAALKVALDLVRSGELNEVLTS